MITSLISRSRSVGFASGLAVLTALSVSPRASAATVGTDVASNYTTATWTTGSNLGTGFGAWALSNNNNGTSIFAGNFIGDATANTSGNGNINTAGSSFGMYANPNGAFINADRSFAGGALTLNQTFSLKIAVNFRNGSKGINLYTGGTGGTQVFNFNIGSVSGTDGYYYQIGAGAPVNTGLVYAADSVFTLSYTQSGAAAGTFSINRTSAGTPAANGIVNVPLPATSGVDAFRIYDSNATNSNSDNLFFNNLSVVPEPSTVTLFALGLTGLAAAVRRRRSVR